MINRPVCKYRPEFQPICYQIRDRRHNPIQYDVQAVEQSLVVLDQSFLQSDQPGKTADRIPPQLQLDPDIITKMLSGIRILSPFPAEQIPPFDS